MTYQAGQISEIDESKGARSGKIYKVGLYWFFEDELVIDMESIIHTFLKRIGIIELDDGFNFDYKNEIHNLQGLCHTEHFVYLVATNESGKVKFINMRRIKQVTAYRVFNHIRNKFQSNDDWKEINIE